MNPPALVYVSYIASTPERVWEALTDPELIQQYWCERRVESTWQPGALVTYWADAERRTLDVTGEILRAEPPRVLAYTFQAYPGGEVLRERPSRVTFEIAPFGNGVVRLTMTHDEFVPDSAVLPGVRNGWPAILSSLKSLLEGGAPLPFGSDWESGGPAPVA